MFCNSILKSVEDLVSFAIVDVCLICGLSSTV